MSTPEANFVNNLVVNPEGTKTQTDTMLPSDKKLENDKGLTTALFTDTTSNQYRSVFFDNKGQYNLQGLDALNKISKQDFLRLENLAKEVDDKGIAKIPDALFDLATCYRFGICTKENPIKVYDCVFQAAQAGLSLANWILGDLFLHPTYLKHLKLQKTEKEERSYQNYLVAANQDLAIAQYSLAELYSTKKAIPQNDRVEPYRSQRAFYWYKRAADLGLASAQHALAVSYKDNLGVPADEQNQRYTHAAKYCRMAAAQNFMPAVDQLAALEYLANPFRNFTSPIPLRKTVSRAISQTASAKSKKIAAADESSSSSSSSSSAPSSKMPSDASSSSSPADSNSNSSSSSNADWSESSGSKSQNSSNGSSLSTSLQVSLTPRLEPADSILPSSNNLSIPVPGFPNLPSLPNHFNQKEMATAKPKSTIQPKKVKLKKSSKQSTAVPMETIKPVSLPLPSTASPLIQPMPVPPPSAPAFPIAPPQSQQPAAPRDMTALEILFSLTCSTSRPRSQSNSGQPNGGQYPLPQQNAAANTNPRFHVQYQPQHQQQHLQPQQQQRYQQQQFQPQQPQQHLQPQQPQQHQPHQLQTRQPQQSQGGPNANPNFTFSMNFTMSPGFSLDQLCGDEPLNDENISSSSENNNNNLTPMEIDQRTDDQLDDAVDNQTENTGNNQFLTQFQSMQNQNTFNANPSNKRKTFDSVPTENHNGQPENSDNSPNKRLKPTPLGATKPNA